MPIEGPLKELSIQDVLQMLDLAQKTGVLTVRSERRMDEAVVHLVDGALVLATRRRSLRLLGQQLLRAGKLTAEELDRALEAQRRDPSRRLGAVLVEMGSVDQADLERQLRFQIEETIYDLLGWTDGYFRFEETTDTEDGPVRVRVDSLLMEGARRLDEWARLAPRVPSPEIVPVLAPGRKDDGLVDLGPEEWEVLAEIDGEKDLRHIASELGRSAFDVAKVVYGLDSMNLITVTDRRTGSDEQTLTPLLDELELLLADGEAEAAERRARELGEEYPDRAEFPIVVGRALAARRRLRAAADAFDRAVALDPLSSEAHYQLGLAAARAGEWDRAETALGTFLRLSRGGARRTHARRTIAAIHELREILEQAPTE